MRTDSEIQKDAEDELRWDARIKGNEIKVSVKSGHLTLSGNVDAYIKKIDAEKATMRVAGVISVSNELLIKIPESHRRTDSEIEKTVLDAIKWNAAIEAGKIKVNAKDGWVTLEGTVEWEYQRSRARTLAEDITGVNGVTNLIEVVSTFVSSPDVKSKIDAALKRNYYFAANNIMVRVEGSRAILSGKVHTLAEKAAAETAAWSAPGVSQVENNIEISYEEIFA
jgi:osmotically-inducible protein OsmY